MTEKLHELLKAAGSGVYRLAGRTGAKTIQQAAEAAGWQFCHVDGAEVKGKAAFLKRAGEALRFPEWAGHNWDAFEELVNDLAWLGDRADAGAGVVLLLDRMSHFSQAQPKEARLAVEILETAARNRAKDGERPLVVLLRGAGTAAAHLPSLEVNA